MSVINGNDSGPGSLRQAILDAPAGSIIQINSPDPIVLDSTIIIDKNLDIAADFNQIITISDTGVFDTYVFDCQSASVAFTNISFQGNPVNVGVSAIRLINLIPGSGTTTILALTQCSVDNWQSPTTGENTETILVRNASLDMQNSFMLNNSGYVGPVAVRSGGTGFLNEMVLCTLNNCVFSGNNFVFECSVRVLTLDIENGQASVSIFNTRFENNRSSESLCGLILTVLGSLGRIFLQDVVFADNEAEASNCQIALVVEGNNSEPGAVVRNVDILRNISRSFESGLAFTGFGAAWCDISGCIIDSNNSLHCSGINFIGSTAPSANRKLLQVRNTTIMNCNSTETQDVFPGSGAVQLLGDNIDMEMINVTFASNVGYTSGGIASGLWYAPSVTQNIRLWNCTFAGNGSFLGGGAINIIPGTNLEMHNSLFALNYDNDLNFSNITGAVNILSTNNLVSVDVGMTGITNGANGNIIGTLVAPIDAGLGDLGIYGGDRQMPVAPLFETSIAVGAGNNAQVRSPYDARGDPFVRVWPSPDGIVDIGAFEFQPFLVPCLDGESLVHVRSVSTQDVSVIPIKNVRAKAHEVYDMINNTYIPIRHNAVIQGSSVIYRIPKEILGASQDLLITSGHFVHFEGRPVKARDIPGAIRLSTLGSIVYTIISEEWVPIKINNIGVYTWSQYKWDKIVRKEGIIWKENI